MDKLTFKGVHRCGREIPIEFTFGVVKNRIVIEIGDCEHCAAEARAEVYDEGFTQGMEEGEEKGYEEGFAEGKEAEDEPTDEHGRVIKEPIEIQYVDQNYTGA